METAMRRMARVPVTAEMTEQLEGTATLANVKNFKGKLAEVRRRVDGALDAAAHASTALFEHWKLARPVAKRQRLAPSQPPPQPQPSQPQQQHRQPQPQPQPQPSQPSQPPQPQPQPSDSPEPELAFESTGMWQRDNAIMVLCLALQMAQSPLSAALEMEQQLYEMFLADRGDDDAAYIRAVRVVFNHMAPETEDHRPLLPFMVLAGTVTPADLVSMTPEQLMAAESRAMERMRRPPPHWAHV